jgi:hypothetical protein
LVAISKDCLLSLDHGSQGLRIDAQLALSMVRLSMVRTKSCIDADPLDPTTTPGAWIALDCL